jgi:hypothetical protein
MLPWLIAGASQRLAGVMREHVPRPGAAAEHVAAQRTILRWMQLAGRLQREEPLALSCIPAIPNGFSVLCSGAAVESSSIEVERSNLAPCVGSDACGRRWEPVRRWCSRSPPRPTRAVPDPGARRLGRHRAAWPPAQLHVRARADPDRRTGALARRHARSRRLVPDRLRAGARQQSGIRVSHDVVHGARCSARDVPLPQPEAVQRLHRQRSGF